MGMKWLAHRVTAAMGLDLFLNRLKGDPGPLQTSAVRGHALYCFSK